MEYKLVPVSKDLEELKVTLPTDIVVKSRNEIEACLSARGCGKDNKGRLRINGRALPHSSYDHITEYLSTGKGKKPRGLRKLLNSVKIPKKLLPKNR